MDLGFSDFGHFGSVCKGYDLVFRILDVLDALSQGLDLVFPDIGPDCSRVVFLLDFGLTYNVFSFA